MRAHSDQLPPPLRTLTALDTQDQCPRCGEGRFLVRLPEGRTCTTCITVAEAVLVKENWHELYGELTRFGRYRQRYLDREAQA